MRPSGLSLPELPPVLLALGSRGSRLLDLAPSDVPEEVASHVIGTVPPWNARREAEIGRLEDDADAALAWGERWLASIAQHPWMRPFDASRQGWVCGSDLRTPGPDLFRPPTTLSPRCLNCGLVSEHGSLGTTTTVVDGGLGPLPDEIRTPEGAPIWRLTMADSARVRDIRTCEDWTSLVAAHPRLISDVDVPVEPGGVSIPGPVYSVDWTAASSDLDGVRLTLEGLARVAYVEMPVLDGATTIVPGDVAWEHTLWLRWVVVEASRPGAGTASLTRRS